MEKMGVGASLPCLPSPPSDVPMRRTQVIVTEGDLKQLLGRVTKVLDDGRVEMMPTMEGLDQALVFEARQLQKYFQARTQTWPRVGNTCGGGDV